jgi:hypothetical protein
MVSKSMLWEHLCFLHWFPDDRDRDGSQNIGLLNLMRLLTQENFIEFNRHQSFKLCFIVLLLMNIFSFLKALPTG